MVLTLQAPCGVSPSSQPGGLASHFVREWEQHSCRFHEQHITYKIRKKYLLSKILTTRKNKKEQNLLRRRKKVNLELSGFKILTKEGQGRGQQKDDGCRKERAKSTRRSG
jgi:hypothetical protein